MPPPPESDDSTDIFNNEKLKETISSKDLEFDDWTLLISELEKSFPDDIDKLSLVYDAFLLEFPLCHGYWRKYAYHKIKLSTLQDVVEVFERAILVATFSVPVWLDYCEFGVAAYEDHLDVSRLFERGLSFVGKDYSCCDIWDKYIEFLLDQKQWSSLAHVYLRTLRYPSKKLHFYYKNFGKIAALLKEKIKCRIDVSGDLSLDLMDEDLVVKRHTDEEISVVIKDLMGPSSSSAVAKALHAYLSIGEQFYKDSQKLMEKISSFETHICRPYFHVKPLDTNQLDNWHAYLSFAETYGDFDWAIKLYERCLIPCANYTEFWFRYVDFVESKGGRELANFALARASQTFVKNASVVHLFNARFKEHVGDASAASVALSRISQCGEELGVGFVENVTKKANMEKRLGNFEAAVTIYREALKKALSGKQNSESTAQLYIQFSRLKYMITNSADEAAQILIEGNEKVPHCKSLLEELIRLLMMHGGSRQVDMLDPIIDKEICHQEDFSDGLSSEDKEEISNLYMELIDLSGTIHDVRKALARHIKLFPHSARAKLHGSRPSGKSFRELIQRREKIKELSTDNDIGNTIALPPEEKKELHVHVNPDGSVSKDARKSDYLNTTPNLGSLASELQVQGNTNVAEREKLSESQSDQSIGLKADDGGESSREPIQATPKQVHFPSTSVDTLKSDVIEIQPSGSWSPRSYQNQESFRQGGRNRPHRNELNQNHRDWKPHPQSIGQQTGTAPLDNQAALLSSVSQNQNQNSASQLHPTVQTSSVYHQTHVHGQHTSVVPSTNPTTLQSSVSQNPQSQYQASTSQVPAYPQTPMPQNPVQSYDQQSQMQSNEAYNQMWQQYYYNYYYYQQQQQLQSQQSQPNQSSQPQLDQNLMQLLSKQCQSQAGTQYSQPRQVEQLKTKQHSQEPQNQQQIQFQQQQEWYQWQQQQQQQQYLLYLQQQQLQGEVKGDEHRPSAPQVSTKESDIQKSQEASGNEADPSSDTSINSI